MGELERNSERTAETRCTVTAVIPAYNEDPRVGSTVREVLDYVDEVIVVDDGSEDDTAERAEAAGARVLRQPENRGYVAALVRGFGATRTEVVVTLDADGEMPAERIPDLVAPIRDGVAAMVQGHRPRAPRPSESFLTRVARLAGQVGDSGTGFRSIRTDLAQSVELDGHCLCGVLALEVLFRGERILDVPIELRTINKKRKVAWLHMLQLRAIVKRLLRAIVRRRTS